MNGIYLQDIIINSPHVGKSEIKILVELLLRELLNGNMRLMSDKGVTVDNDTETLLLSP